MADLQKPIRQVEERLGEVSREILRIESHLRRGELRAASARIQGARAQLAALQGDRETPMQMALIGAQLGVLSGGDWLRGRLPAALLCGFGGWMYGQSLSNSQAGELSEIEAHLDRLEELSANPESIAATSR